MRPFACASVHRVHRRPHGQPWRPHFHAYQSPVSSETISCGTGKRGLRRVQKQDCNSILSLLRSSQEILRGMRHRVAYQLVTSGKVPLEDFKKKQLFLSDLQLRIKQELIGFDAFIGKVVADFDTLLETVRTKKEAVLRDLQAKRAELAAAVQEAQRAIEGKRYLEEFELTTVLDEYIANGSNASAPVKIELFEGTVDMQKVSEVLERAVQCEVFPKAFVEERPRNGIPVLKGNTLRLYDTRTLQMTERTLIQTARADHMSAYCYILPDAVFCYGGSGHNEASEVNVRTGAVVTVQNSSGPRSYVGLWNENKHVFIFGGYSASPVNTADQYSTAAKTFRSLRNPMQKGKYCCSVCEHSSGLYISGVDNAGSALEHFNPQGEVFTLLRTDTIRCAPMLICVGQELYCIRQGAIEVASLANGPTAATFKVKTTINSISSTGWYWLSCPVVWQEGKIIGVINSCGSPEGLFSFDTTASTMTKIVTFAY